MEAPLPKLIADDHYGMRALALILSGQEAAAERRGYADGGEIVGGDDATGGALGAIANAERGASNLADEGAFAQRAASLEILEIRPGKRGAFAFASGSTGYSNQAFLVDDSGIRAEQDALDPTENRSIRADPYREAKNGQQRKPRVAPERS